MALNLQEVPQGLFNLHQKLGDLSCRVLRLKQ